MHMHIRHSHFLFFDPINKFSKFPHTLFCFSFTFIIILNRGLGINCFESVKHSISPPKRKQLSILIFTGCYYH